MEETEIWMPVVGYEDIYEVSHFGRVKRVLKASGPTTEFLKPSNKIKRFTVKLSWLGKLTTFSVHTLVLGSFNCPRPDDLECCHNDGNPLNNYIGNLRWDTRKSNQHDAIKHGTSILRPGENHGTVKLTNSDIRNIKKLLSEGVWQVEIAKRYNTTQGNISKIKLNKSWTHLNEQQ